VDELATSKSKIKFNRRGTNRLRDAADVAIVESYPLRDLNPSFLEAAIPPEKSNHDDACNKLHFDKAYKGRLSRSTVPLWVQPQQEHHSLVPFSKSNKYVQTKSKDEIKSVRIKSERVRRIQLPNLVLTILAFVFFLPRVLCQNNKSANETTMQLIGSFNFCESPNMNSLVDINNLCYNRKPNPKQFDLIKENLGFSYMEKLFKSSNDSSKPMRQLYIMGVLDQIEFGKAYQCKKIQVVATYFSSFFGYKSESIRRIPLQLTANECWVMKLSGKCGNNLMNCDGDNCEFYPTLTPEYNWNSDTRILYEECIISSRFISAKNVDSKIIAPHCSVKDKQCVLHDSVVVWDKTVIHECPLYEIGSSRFELKENILISTTENHLAFEAVSVTEQCGVKMVSTSDGLFIASVKPVSIIQKAPGLKDMKGLIDMTLADADYDKIVAIRKRSELITDLCNMLTMSIKMHMHETNSYFKIPDLNGHQIILYVNEGNLYKPLCAKIYKIQFINASKCYYNAPIEFAYSNKTVKGFLGQDNILYQIGMEKICSNSQSTYYLMDGFTVTYTGNISTYFNNSLIHTVDLNIVNGLLETTDLTHNKAVVDSIDAVSEFIKLNERSGDELDTIFNPNSEDALDSKFENFKDHTVKYFLTNSIFKIFCILAAIFIFMLCACSIYMSCNPILGFIRCIKSKSKQDRIAFQPISYDGKRVRFEDTIPVPSAPAYPRSHSLDSVYKSCLL
jgi:hypothetical protein